MDSGNSSCSRTRRGLVGTNDNMDLSNGSCSRTRSGLVRHKSFMGSSDDSCSRTRSGLVRRKGFIGSSNDSCSRTRSGLVRRKSFMGSSNGSCSRTQSGLVRQNGFMDSSDGSYSRTRSGIISGSPSVKAPIMDGPVRKGLPDADGQMIEETPSRTRSGLVRQSPIVKVRNFAKNVTVSICLLLLCSRKIWACQQWLSDGWQREDMHVATQSGHVRGNSATETRREDEPVIAELADGWLKEHKPLGTQGGLIRGNLPFKALTKVESITKGQHGKWLKEDGPVETQSGIFRGSHSMKILSNDESVTKELPDGWWKEYRPRKPGSSQKNDPYYIDPFSEYEFRSLKDVHRYLQTGDIRQCAMRPQKRILYDVCITENQTHTCSSSQQTRPGTADKGIQCEIITSEGIMLPQEELFTPHREKNIESTVLPESKSIKAMERYGNKCEDLQKTVVQALMAHCAPRKTKFVKRKDKNIEVKSKKHKSESVPTVTPLRALPHLAALTTQSEASNETEDQLININHINQLENVEESNNDQPEMSQLSIMNKMHGNEERAFNQLWANIDSAINGLQATQEKTAKHLHPGQVNTNGHQLQSSLADTDISMPTVHGYATDQPSQADNMDHKHTNVKNTISQLQSCLLDTVNHREMNQENTAHELQSGLEDTVLPKQAMREYTANQLRQPGNMNHRRSGLADTIIPIRSIREFTNDHSQLSNDDSMNQIQANQSTADKLQLGQAETVTQLQRMQDNTTCHSQMIQVNSLNQIHVNLQNTKNHLESNYAENPLLQPDFSWDAEQNGGSLVTDFWSIESQDSSVPMQLDGVPVASFSTNVKFQSAAAPAAAEHAIPSTQATTPVTAPDQSGLVVPSPFDNAWSDPCIEFAFKTLTGDIPVLDDTAAVTEYFPQQLDLNKGTTPNCSASALDNNKIHTQIDVNLPLPTQVDVNLPLPRPSDKTYNGSWFPPL